MSATFLLVLAIPAFLLSFLATGAAYALLRRAKVLDIPNARSNHTRPTPRGGGIGILCAAVPLLWLAGAPAAVIGGMLLLAAVSFRDDLRPLPARLRFLAQVAAVGLALLMAYDGRIAPFLPAWLELPLLALGWLWFINLFNFMDGSDGLAGGEALCIGAGAALLAALGAAPAAAGYGMAVLAAASAGFLLWNWHPAKIFMGDVGSIPLGFVLGYGLLQLAASGLWAAALILPAVFVADATLTLLARAWRRERLSQAHSSHYYQQAIRRGFSHAKVAGEVMAVNLLLAMLAAGSAFWPLAGQGVAVLLAYLMVFGLLWRFAGYTTQRDGKKQQR